MTRPYDDLDALFTAQVEGYCSARMLAHRSHISLGEARQVLEELRAMGCMDAFPDGKTMRYYITGAGKVYYDRLSHELDPRRRLSA